MGKRYDVGEQACMACWEFGVLPVDDSRVVRTMNAIKEGFVRLDWIIGGIAQVYKRLLFPAIREIHNEPANPWIICTLWIANFQNRIRRQPCGSCRTEASLQWVEKTRSRAVYCRSSSIRWTALHYPLRLLLGHMQHSCKL